MSLIQKSKIKELILFPIYFLVIATVVSIFKLSYLPTVILFFGVSSLYITLRKKQIFKKTFLVSFVGSLTIVFVIDYIGTINHIWFEVSTLKIFILNVVPLDALIWGFLFFYFLISFYEYFLDRDKNKRKFSDKTKYLIYILAGILMVFGTIYSIDKRLFVVNSFYLLFVVLLFLLPIILVLTKHIGLWKKTLFISLGGLLHALIYEFAALDTGQWIFDGKYIGWVTLFGFKFPIEEFLFLILSAPALILIYEYFLDDEK